ncbi:phage recombination protein Bet [Deinococcus altitudinis]|uniref:phage recombination protein Bet n=1 Tax=Deinococcus altitudinis TaxID=468914 RepID=UPI0038912FC7
MTQLAERTQQIEPVQPVERAQQLERPQVQTLTQPAAFSAEQVELIKNTVAVGTSDLELALFMEVCRSTGLNPFQRQIYAVVRKGKTKVNNQWVESSKMVIQTGIDGYRLIASRSGLHMGTTDPEFAPLKDGYPEWARVVVRKMVRGHIVDFPATARWSEYVQTKAEYSGGSATGKQIVSDMWAKMPHTMLGKCAEALALRKAFPAELSGVYSDIEMQQADSETAPVQQARTADVTREVAQAAGVPVQQAAPVRSEALLAWEEKIGKVGTRLTELGLRDQARAVMAQYPHWKTEVSAAAAVYETMKQIGARHAEEVAARTAQEDDLPNAATLPLDIDEPVEAEIVGEGITAARLKALQIAYSTKLKLTTSNDRHYFAEWFLSLPTPIQNTNQLTEEQGKLLLDTIGSWDEHAVETSMADFRKWQSTAAPF